MLKGMETVCILLYNCAKGIIFNFKPSISSTNLKQLTIVYAFPNSDYNCFKGENTSLVCYPIYLDKKQKLQSSDDIPI